MVLWALGEYMRQQLQDWISVSRVPKAQQWAAFDRSYATAVLVSGDTFIDGGSYVFGTRSGRGGKQQIRGGIVHPEQFWAAHIVHDNDRRLLVRTGNDISYQFHPAGLAGEVMEISNEYHTSTHDIYTGDPLETEEQRDVLARLIGFVPSVMPVPKGDSCVSFQEMYHYQKGQNNWARKGRTYMRIHVETNTCPRCHARRVEF